MSFRTPSVDYGSLFETINNSNQAATQYSEFAASKNTQYNATMKAYYNSVASKADETQSMLNHAEHLKTASGQADILSQKDAQYERPYTGNGTYGGSSFMVGNNCDTCT